MFFFNGLHVCFWIFSQHEAWKDNTKQSCLHDTQWPRYWKRILCSHDLYQFGTQTEQKVYWIIMETLLTWCTFTGEKKKKKSVSRGGEERPQQAETWTAADSYGLAQQRYKLEPVLQGLESVISGFYVLILHIFAHPWTYLQQPT